MKRPQRALTPHLASRTDVQAECTTTCTARLHNDARDIFLIAQKCRWRKGFLQCSVFSDDCGAQGKRATRVRLQKLSQPRVKHTKRLVQKIFCQNGPANLLASTSIRLELSESAAK